MNTFDVRVERSIPSSYNSAVPSYDTFVQGTSQYQVQPQSFGAISFEGMNGNQLLPLGAAATTSNNVMSNTNDNITSMLPVNGGVAQPIVYDRFIFANSRSRRRYDGDAVRGDLPIVPISYPNKLVSPSAQLDLRPGYLNMISGPDNVTGKQLDRLIYASSGNTQNIIGGIDLSDKFNDPTSPWYTGNLNTGIQGNVTVNKWRL